MAEALELPVQELERTVNMFEVLDAFGFEPTPVSAAQLEAAARGEVELPDGYYVVIGEESE